MSQFITIAHKDDILEGHSKRIVHGDYRLAVFRAENEFYVIDDRCSHAEASLSEGVLEGRVVSCPRHGAKFDITNGKALSMPAFKPVRAYKVRLQGEQIQVELDDEE